VNNPRFRIHRYPLHNAESKNVLIVIYGIVSFIMCSFYALVYPEMPAVKRFWSLVLASLKSVQDGMRSYKQ
jgi:hypothetical protein